MTDLSTRYLGLALPHPFVLGASPLTSTFDGARAAEDAGAAALVLRSVFEEQLSADALATHGATESHGHSYAEALSYLPSVRGDALGPEASLELVRRLTEALDIPVVASLNGHTPGGWVDHATRLAQAGADALELNVFDVVTDPARSSVAVEDELVALVAQVTSRVTVPVAVKLSPFYTALPHLARRLVEAGAAGLVLFNRFYEPDVDTEELELRSELHLSSPRELLLRLRWLAILSGQVDVSLAVTGGVHDALGAIKAVMAGAHAVQVVSALLQHGPAHLRQVREQTAHWMEEHGYASLTSMRGNMDWSRCPDPDGWARGNYISMLKTWRPD